jgi:hypothetical protein
MRILGGVRTDLAENRKISKGRGFLGNNNYPRVSRILSHTLTGYDDGRQVNIPALLKFVKSTIVLSDKRNYESETIQRRMGSVMQKSIRTCIVKIADSKSQ